MKPPMGRFERRVFWKRGHKCKGPGAGSTLVCFWNQEKCR